MTPRRGWPSRSIPAASPRAAPPGSSPSAGRTAIQGPRPLSKAGPARSARRSARRSNSAVWRKAAPTSTLALPPPANGTSRPAMPSSPRPVAGSPARTRPICISVAGGKISSCRNSSPGAIPRRRADLENTLLGQRLLQFRPAQIGALQHARRIGREGVPGLLAAEQIKPLPRDQPEPRIARDRDPARQIDRVVAAILRTVNIGVGDKGRTIARVAETPDRTGFGGLEIRQSELGTGVGKIRHGVETLDGKTGKAVHRHPLGGRGPGRRRQAGKPPQTRASKAHPNEAHQDLACPRGDQGNSGAKDAWRTSSVSFLPFCRHS